MTIVGIFLFTGIAQADVCLKIMRQEHWMSGLKQSEINRLSQEELREYEARTRPFDIVAIYRGQQCSNPPAVQDPTSATITVVVNGLDYEDALHFQEPYYDFTGKLDPDTGRSL